ncbi:MAG: hypothetical protein LBE13_04300 [Bacteroidales bacterium]|jgi:hypothetical protein|nr:hypothetical protein [Bacteroidales bacterium]
MTLLLALLLTLTGVYVLLLLYFRAKTKKKVAQVFNQFMSRPQCLDDEFICACAIDSLSNKERLFIIKLRKCIAKLAKVPDTSIYATDVFNDTILFLPFWNNFDGNTFVSELSNDVKLTFGQKQLQSITSPEISSNNYKVRDFVFEWIRAIRSS